ncbi:hypothetical protein [Streptomyces lutosisoli]|uniref:Lipoprotein n=1 Tax=Streptomyces lutosisoli TaxID=2665721 RepID=A0ABW2VD56_9ACTN
MARTTHRTRGFGRGRMLPALLGAVALPALSACSSPAAAPEASRGAPSMRPAAVTYTMPADVSRLVLPTTGAEARGTQGLDGFVKLASAWAVDGCARNHEVAVPDAPPPMFTRSSDLPDLDFLRIHGFDDGALVPGAPRRASTAPATAASDPVVQRCQAEGSAVARELQESYGALLSTWFAELAPVNRAPKVRQAYGEFADCLAAHHVNAVDEAAFFALADERRQAGDAAGSRRLASVYAGCMKPVEAVREPLRKELNRTFRAAHAAEIAKVRSELPKKIHEFEKRYGIRIAFPKL